MWRLKNLHNATDPLVWCSGVTHTHTSQFFQNGWRLLLFFVVFLIDLFGPLLNSIRIICIRGLLNMQITRPIDEVGGVAQRRNHAPPPSFKPLPF